MKTQYLKHYTTTLFALILMSSSVVQAERSFAVKVVNSGDNPLPVEVFNSISNNANQRQLVGISTQTPPATFGVVLLNDACNADFPGSRMCTTEEINNSVSISGLDLTNERAWVRPLVVKLPIISSTNNRLVQVDNASGLTTEGIKAHSFDCAGYSRFTNQKGTVIGQNGTFSTSDCNINRRVACCASVANQ